MASRKAMVFNECADYIPVCNRSDDEELWLRERRSTVGASSQLSDSELKQATGVSKPFTGNMHTRFGQWLEEPTLLAFGQWAGIEIAPTDTLLRSKVYPWMSATPDGLGRVKHKSKLRDYLRYELYWPKPDAERVVDYSAEFLIEVKTPGLKQLPEWGDVSWKKTKYKVAEVDEPWYYPMYEAPKETPPYKYFVQCQHQMVVTGHNLCLLLGMVGGKQFITFAIWRDGCAATKRIQQTKAFMERVEKETRDEMGRH